MGTLGRTQWLVGWSLHSDARSRSFLCALCDYCTANGGLDADVEERQLSPSSPPRWILCRVFGNRIVLIAIFDCEKTMARNGITWSKMRCERD